MTTTIETRDTFGAPSSSNTTKVLLVVESPVMNQKKRRGGEGEREEKTYNLAGCDREIEWDHCKLQLCRRSIRSSRLHSPRPPATSNDRCHARSHKHDLWSILDKKI